MIENNTNEECTLLIQLGALTSDAASELDIFGHDCDPLRVNCAQVRVFEQSHQIRLRRLLQRHHRRALEPKVALEILCDFTYKSLKWQFADQ